MRDDQDRKRSNAIVHWIIIFTVFVAATPSFATPIAHLVLHSQPGDFVGGGVDSDITSSNISAQVRRTLPSGSPAELLFFLFIPPPVGPNSFLLLFGTDQLGIPIQPGSYLNAQRADFAAAGHPGLDVSGNGRGCNMVTGNFTISNVSFLPGNIVNSFDASFEEHCEGATPALLGTFDYSASGTLPNPVPEPSTWILLGSGLVGLILWRKQTA